MSACSSVPPTPWSNSRPPDDSAGFQRLRGIYDNILGLAAAGVLTRQLTEPELAGGLRSVGFEDLSPEELTVFVRVLEQARCHQPPPFSEVVSLIGSTKTPKSHESLQPTNSIKSLVAVNSSRLPYPASVVPAPSQTLRTSTEQKQPFAPTAPALEDTWGAPQGPREEARLAADLALIANPTTSGKPKVSKSRAQNDSLMREQNPYNMDAGALVAELCDTIQKAKAQLRKLQAHASSVSCDQIVTLLDGAIRNGKDLEARWQVAEIAFSKSEEAARRGLAQLANICEESARNGQEVGMSQQELAISNQLKLGQRDALTQAAILQRDWLANRFAERQWKCRAFTAMRAAVAQSTAERRRLALGERVAAHHFATSLRRRFKQVAECSYPSEFPSDTPERTSSQARPERPQLYRQLSTYRPVDVAPPDPGLPLIVFDRFDYDSLIRNSRLCARLKMLLKWAEPLIPSGLRVIDIRPGTEARPLIPELFPPGYEAFEAMAEIIHIHVGRSAIGHEITAERALVCSGSFEELMYPCHDLLRDGVKEVGFVPHLNGPSSRSGKLSKQSVCSHLEEILQVRAFPSLQLAVDWLVPGCHGFPKLMDMDCGLKITVESQDNTVLNEVQQSIISQLFEEEVTALRLTKLGKGYSAALKFFCVPKVVKNGTETFGCVSFIKMGEEEEIHEELLVTQHMMLLLGAHCPQVLGYSEMADSAAVHLSLVNLHKSPPRGFADLYSELVSPTKVIVGTEEGRLLAKRIQSAIDFVFTELTTRLHASKADTFAIFSVADELGLCKDFGGKDGTETDLHMSSAWVLEKLWRKKPGDGGLASSVSIHTALTLGTTAAKDNVLTFLPGHPLRRRNLHLFLSDKMFLVKLRDGSTFEIRGCFVHGDLHGDNIMVDGNDNRFLIDFGKTTLGHPLEDILWLEAFILLSYTDYENDEELADCLHMVPALAPTSGDLLESSDATTMEGALTKPIVNLRMKEMWAILKSLRSHLQNQISDVAATSRGDVLLEQRRCSAVGLLLSLRNALFFLGARENKEAPRRRRLALALACSYAECLASIL